jgi:hypothetical protein
VQQHPVPVKLEKKCPACFALMLELVFNGLRQVEKFFGEFILEASYSYAVVLIRVEEFITVDPG